MVNWTSRHWFLASSQVLIVESDSTVSIPVELSGRVQILESGDLLISNVRESDAGLYTCTRANEAGSVTGGAHLGVMGKEMPKNKNEEIN